MAGKFTGLINKLQKALLMNCNRIIYIENEQFYSKEQNRVITMFVLSERVWNEERGRFTKQQVLKTASQIDVVKYLGNLYKELTNTEINA